MLLERSAVLESAFLFAEKEKAKCNGKGVAFCAKKFKTRQDFAATSISKMYLPVIACGCIIYSKLLLLAFMFPQQGQRPEIAQVSADLCHKRLQIYLQTLL